MLTPLAAVHFSESDAQGVTAAKVAPALVALGCNGARCPRVLNWTGSLPDLVYFRRLIDAGLRAPVLCLYGNPLLEPSSDGICESYFQRLAVAASVQRLQWQPGKCEFRIELGNECNLGQYWQNGNVQRFIEKVQAIGYRVLSGEGYRVVGFGTSPPPPDMVAGKVKVLEACGYFEACDDGCWHQYGGTVAENRAGLAAARAAWPAGKTMLVTELGLHLGSLPTVEQSKAMVAGLVKNAAELTDGFALYRLLRNSSMGGKIGLFESSLTPLPAAGAFRDALAQVAPLTPTPPPVPTPVPVPIPTPTPAPAYAVKLYQRDIDTGAEREIGDTLYRDGWGKRSVIHYDVQAVPHSVKAVLVDAQNHEQGSRILQSQGKFSYPGKSKPFAPPASGQYSLSVWVYDTPDGSGQPVAKLSVPLAVADTAPLPPPPIIQGTVLNSPEDFAGAAGASKVDNYVIPAGANWDMTTAPAVDFKNASTFRGAPGAVLSWKPATVRTLFATHAPCTIADLKLDTNVNARVLSPWVSGATLQRIDFVGDALSSFIERGANYPIDRLILEDITFPFAVDRYVTYWEVSPGVWHSDWVFRRLKILKGSVNEGPFRLKSLRNLLLEDCEIRDTGGSKLYAGVFEFCDGAVMRGGTVQSEWTVMPNDGNPASIFTNVQWSRNCQFINVTFDDGSLRFNPGTQDVLVDGCRIVRRSYPHIIHTPPGTHGLNPPSGIIRNTTVTWEGAGAAPPFIDGGPNALTWQGQGNTYDGQAL
jgi:hypothetical protein